jgi:hypothetical protein
MSVSAAARPRAARLSLPRDEQTGIWLAVGGLTLAALLLRLLEIHQSLLGDEVYTYQDVVGHSLRSVITTVHTGGENSPPLFFLLAWATAKLGDPSVWLRLPSVIAGALTVPLVFAVGARTVGRRAGVVAAAIVAVAPFTVFYGIEARPYATMTCFVALSTVALLRALEDGSRRWWTVYALAAAAAAYTHYTAVFVLAVQAAWSLWRAGEARRTALVANALVALLYVPWLPELRGKALATIGALYPLGPSRVLGDLLRPFPGDPSAPLSVIPTIAGLIIVGIALALGALAIARQRAVPGSGAARRFRTPGAGVLLTASMLATPVGLLLYSLLVTDLWLPRGLSASLPSEAVLIGALLVAPPRPVAALAVAAVLGVLVFGTVRSLSPAHNRGPYRTIAAYLDDAAGPRDPVVLGTYSGAGPIQAQLRRPLRIVGGVAPITGVPEGGRAFVVLDELLARRHVFRVPPHPGLRLLSSRRYGAGLLTTDVLVFGATG